MLNKVKLKEMENKFTPGPWKRGKHNQMIVADTADGLDIFGAASNSAFHHYGGFLIAESVSSCNSSIIAAAPELLEALQDLSQAYLELLTDQHLTKPDAYECAQAALTKALTINQ